MNSLDLIALSRHTEFLDRVQVITSFVCQEITKEDSEEPETDKRKRYATMLLNNASGFLNRFALALVSSIPIAQTIEIDGNDITKLKYTGQEADGSLLDGMDKEIKTAIELIFNSFAGVYNLEENG